MGATLDQELEELLAGLGPMEQKEVLEYARALRDGDADGDGDDDDGRGGSPAMVHLIGSILKEDLRALRDAIEQEGVAGVILVRFVGPFPEEEMEQVRDAVEEEVRRSEQEDVKDRHAA